MERFEKISELEIRDNKTGLVWRSDYATDKNWQEAMNYAKALGEQWRLPTIVELLALVNYERYKPVSDFPDMPSEWFWSSSSYASDVSHAWVVYFVNGYSYGGDKSGTSYVRCVRSGS